MKQVVIKFNFEVFYSTNTFLIFRISYCDFEKGLSIIQYIKIETLQSIFIHLFTMQLNSKYMYHIVNV